MENSTFCENHVYKVEMGNYYPTYVMIQCFAILVWGKINSDLSCNRFCEFYKQFCLSCRWLGETEAPETEESKGWKEKGEEDWDGGKQETGEMWGFNSQLLIVFLKKLVFFFFTLSDFFTQFRCSWFVRVWFIECLGVFRSRGAHWAGEPPAFSCVWISSSEWLRDADPRVPAGTPVPSEYQPFIR